MKTKKIMEGMDVHKLNNNSNNNNSNNDSKNISYYPIQKHDRSDRNDYGDSSSRVGRSNNIAGERRSPSNSLEVRNNSYDNRKLTNEDVFLKSNIEINILNYT